MMIDDPPDRAVPDGSPGRGRPRWWSMARKVAVLVVGVPVLVVGLVLLVAPGPGTPIVLAGLAILSLEFDWARRQMHRIRDGARKLIEKISADERS